MSQTNTVRQMRQAIEAEQKRSKKLNQRLLAYEAREALETKLRVAYSMARQGKFPDAGVRFFMELVRDDPERDVKQTYADLLEAYTDAGTLKTDD